MFIAAFLVYEKQGGITLNQNTFVTLEFSRIKQQIADFAHTNKGKQFILDLQPSLNEKQISRWQNEITEAVEILKIGSSVPIHRLEGIHQMIEQGNKGLYMRPDQLTGLLSFLDHCQKLKRYMKDKGYVAPTISCYADSIEDLTSLEMEIQRCFRHGQVDDYASKELTRIRKQLDILRTRLKDKVNSMAKSKKYTPFMQDQMVVEKNGRYTLPIKREYRSKVNGTIVDSSSSGATLFIEPNDLHDIQEEILILEQAEEQEIEQILFYLTGLVLEKEQELSLAMDVMYQYDVIFAKAKHSQLIGGTEPQFNSEGRIHLKEARHPLLGKEAVPLSIQFGESERALVITGPNTGGKTVTLKTIGLLTLMGQSGLHISAKKGTELSLFQYIFVDIGDGQSLEQNLSTFSSRIVNIIEILRETNDHSLVLLDELGSGTDPGEGMGLATAILEQLYEKGATIFATTHYSEMKDFADEKEGFMNGSMEFDLETLRPTYRLLLGKTGKSQAFDIAFKLGMHPKILEKAYQITYKTERSFSLPEEELKKPEMMRQAVVNKYARKKAKTQEKNITLFDQGDNVTISATNEVGIVYQGPNERGDYMVQVKGEKKNFNYKRLKLHIRASDLYPDDYDFDIIFKSKEYRKAKHQMERKYIDITLDGE